MQLIQSQQLTMTSREIAELTGKRHDHVMRDIRLMLVELHGDGGVPSFGDTYRNPQNGQEYPVFRLPRREVEILVTGYSITLRAKVIDRLRELESDLAKPRELSRLELLQMALAAEQEKIRIEAERDRAIATKAEIGSRREATAMNTASVAVRKANSLERQLDKAKDYCTVKRMSMIHHGQHFDWRSLKAASAEMELPPIDVFDQNYGTVKAYHVDVWAEVYGLGIDQ
jgi:phage regulator Rha-like protein